MSEDPEPVCNRSVHWAKQKAWVKHQNLSIASLYQQAWWPDYLPYYNTTGVTLGYPWAVDDIQLDPSTQTVYLGGSVSFDTVEDSIQYNLELVDRLFDSAPGARNGAPPAVLANPTGVAEHLLFDLPCNKVDRFISADNSTW